MAEYIPVLLDNLVIGPVRSEIINEINTSTQFYENNWAMITRRYDVEIHNSNSDEIKNTIQYNNAMNYDSHFSFRITENYNGNHSLALYHDALEQILLKDLQIEHSVNWKKEGF